MADLKTKYASAAAITINPDGVANAAARESAAVDNTTNLYLDALVRGKFQTAAGSLGANPVVELWVYSLAYGGTLYTDPATGSDAGITMPTVPVFRLLDIVPIRAANVKINSREVSVAAVFDGVMPDKWGVVVVNKTGLALLGTAGQNVNNNLEFIGVTGQSV